jgi:hypothetical protein
MSGRALGLLALPALAAALGCMAPDARGAYDWGGYDRHLHALMKHPGELDKYGAALKARLDQDPDGRRVPPGLNAEYGYVLMASGRRAEAAECFTREKTRWPESTQLMDRMIAACAPAQAGKEATP